jgi:hypothetical protein
LLCLKLPRRRGADCCRPFFERKAKAAHPAKAAAKCGSEEAAAETKAVEKAAAPAVDPKGKVVELKPAQ